MRTVICFVSLTALACVASADNLRAKIVAMDNAVASAMKKKDMKAMKAAMAPTVTKDFKYIETGPGAAGGKPQTFDEMVANMEMGFSTMKTIDKVETKLLSLSEKGNAATSKSSHLLAGTMVGPDKKSHKFAYSGTSIDTYRKEGGVWKMASMKWADMKMTMDGKPFDPMKAGGK